MEGRRQNGKRKKKVYYLLSTYQVPKVLLNYFVHFFQTTLLTVVLDKWCWLYFYSWVHWGSKRSGNLPSQVYRTTIQNQGDEYRAMLAQQLLLTIMWKRTSIFPSLKIMISHFTLLEKNRALPNFSHNSLGLLQEIYTTASSDVIC